jgi:hypothetical protein
MESENGSKFELFAMRSGAAKAAIANVDVSGYHPGGIPCSSVRGLCDCYYV